MPTHTTTRIHLDELASLETLSPEEQARLFGAGRQQMQPSLETLEGRELLASSLFASLSNGVLRIEGTENADLIHVRQTNGQLSVDGISINVNGSQTPTVAGTAVNHIDIYGLGQDDLIWINSNVTESVTVEGGKGNDLYVFGGATTVNLVAGASDTTIAGDVNTLWKKLESASQLPDGRFDLGNFKFGSYSLKGVNGKVDASGVVLEGQIDAGVLGKMTLTGRMNRDGVYALEAPLAGKSLLGGFLKLDSGKVTLTEAGLSLNGLVRLSMLGNVTLNGTLSPTGTSTLDANFTVAGQKIDGAKTTLGNEQFHIDFSLPVNIPGAGTKKVEFEAAYNSSKKEWLVAGTYPGIVTMGPVVVRDIKVTMASSFLRVEAKGTIAGVDGVVNAQTTGTLYYDGRVDLKVDAQALEVGGFALGKATIRVTNIDENGNKRGYRVTLTGNVGIGDASVKVSGELKADGDYWLKCEKSDIKVFGQKLNDIVVTLSKKTVAAEGRVKGLTFVANWDYKVFKASVSGSMNAEGRVKFSGEGGWADLPSGFTLNAVKVDAVLDAAEKKFQLGISGKIDVFGGDVTFKADIVRKGGKWQTPVLEATGKLRGPLSKYSGDVSFKVTNDAIEFEGDVKLAGVKVEIEGKIYSNGKITTKVTYGNNTINELFEKGERILKEMWKDTGDFISTTYKDGVKTFRKIVKDAGDVIENTYEKGVLAAKKVVTALGDTISTSYDKGVKAFRKEITAAGETIETAYKDGVKAFRRTVKVVDGTIETIENTYENGVLAVKTVTDTLGKTISTAYANGEKAFRREVNEAGETIETTYQNGIRAFSRTVKESGEIIDRVYDNGVIAVRTTMKATGEVIQDLYQGGVKVATNFLTGGGGAAQDYIEHISGFFN